MAKTVRYNGGKLSFYGCTDPKKLRKGKKYKVIAEDVMDWQTDYTLKGVKGEFNSCWFDEVQTVSIPEMIANIIKKVRMQLCNQ